MNSNRPNFKRQKNSRQITYNSKSKRISTVFSATFSISLSVSFSLNERQTPFNLAAYLVGNF